MSDYLSCINFVGLGSWRASWQTGELYNTLVGYMILAGKGLLILGHLCITI